ncbi:MULTISPECIES: APC family permease [Pseudomonas]|uniref:Amino acid permease n=1 Tax=Pseudomonas piscis TaxID=2614538 RepID=U7A4U6_9PSED|nr:MULTISPECIES: APC family permease [Pseudomonas]AZC19174.1 putative amino acid permease, GabP family [Pseudomonas sp. CMR5c]ERO65506.1 AAT family amino acid transporter [Pseudomonas piscis]ERO65572.1 AAT family amino acid transporter [Pseudomonas piscis]MQA56604.1 amino acid permease [Pseudomonas piscis]
MTTNVLDGATGSAAKGGLRRVLGLGSLISVAVGLVVSQGVMVMMLQGAGMAGMGFFIPLLLGYLLALTYALSFSELALLVPRAGSLSSYTEVAIGHFPAILATFSGYMVVAMFALSAELLLLDLIIGKVYPGALPPMVVAYGVLGTFTVLNLLGIDVFAKLQTVLAVVMVVILLTLGLGAIGSPQADLQLPLDQGWNPLHFGALALAAMAIWGFVGAEFVCPLVEETKRPERNIPRSMIIGLSLIFLVITLYCLGALLCIPRDQLASDPLPHFLFATTVFGETGKAFLVGAVLTATCSTVNSSLAALPRMLYGMAQNGQAFPQFKRLSTGTRTPWVAVLFIAAITGLPILLLGQDPDSVSLLLLAAALAWLLAYIIVHIDVIALRRRYPDAPRPFRSPFYPWPQVVGIGGMLFAIYHASPAPEMTARIFGSAGVVLGIISLIAVLWVKLVMHKPLFVPEPLVPAAPTTPSEQSTYSAGERP